MVTPVSTKWSVSVRAEVVVIGRDIKLVRREHVCLNLFKGPIGVPVAHFETGLFPSRGVGFKPLSVRFQF